MLIKNNKIIEKMFKRVYGIACYGEHYNDQNNMNIPYAIETDNEISELTDKIYDLRKKITEEYKDKDYPNIDLHQNLWQLDCLYNSLMKAFCYKMFSYGFNLNPENLNQ